MQYRILIVLLVSWIQPPVVHAAPSGRLDNLLSLSLEELMQVKVTISTDTRQSVAKAPAVISVITAEDLKATGATNLVEALEGIPGVHIRTSQFANRPMIHFRGTKANQTLLMINGSSMKDLAWGFGIFWKGLPVSMIERVEIMRGPGSALFGADASAGVINVITKTAGKIDHSEAGIRLGSYDSQTIWFQHGANWNGFDIGITAEIQGTDGYNPFIVRDGQTANDQANGTNASLAPGVAPYGLDSADLRISVAKGHWRLLADHTHHGDLEIGLTGANVLDPVTHANDNRYNIELFYNNEKFSPNWGLNAELRYRHLDYSSGEGFQERPPGFLGTYPNGVLNRMKSAEHQLAFETSALYSGFKDHSLLLGLGHVWQDLYSVQHQINRGTGPDGNDLPLNSPLVDVSDTPYAFAPEQSRDNDYLFIQDIWNISDHWELTVGARYDRYSDFGDTLNPRAALVWRTTDKLTSKLMYGQAFRAPSFLELFAETSFSIPNPTLAPELSDTWDLAFSYAASKELRLGLNLFHIQQSDVIRAVQVPGQTKLQYQNSGDHSIQGLELEAWWQATEALRISGNYTLREQDDDPNRSYDQPDQDAHLRLDWTVRPGLNWNLQANWIGERPRPTGDARAAVDDTILTDTTVRYSGIKDWDLSLSVRNLFDVDAHEYSSASLPNDLPLPERNLFIEARYSF